jgi:hypothetical protein
MKTYKQFLSENVNISGNASVGTLIINGSDSQPTPVGEQFYADFMWEGNIYRIELVSDSNVLPSREKLGEQIQNEYPGAIVHNIYPLTPTQNSYKVSEVKRYHPSKLEWI